MELKPGYKLTEAGVIPEEWSTDSIGHIATVRTGSKNTQDKVDNGKYPFFVRSQQVERINTYSFDGEAVLTAGDGVGTGKVFHYINGKFDVHQRVYQISNFSDFINGYYFFLFFSNNFYNRIMSMTAKSSVDSVRRTMITDMPVIIPPKNEQTAIANALSDVDSLLASLDALIAKKRDMKQAAMQELLTGNRRLPRFKGEWVESSLSELCSMKSGNGITEESIFNIGKYPCFGGNGLRGFTNTYTHDGDYILIGRQGALCGNVIIAKNKFFASEHALVVTIQGNISIDFLFFLLKQSNLNQYSESSAQPGLSAQKLYSLILKYPLLLAEQTAIAAVLSDMDAEIAALEARRAKTQALKQGMMQELLTGRIRLRPTEGESHA